MKVSPTVRPMVVPDEDLRWRWRGMRARRVDGVTPKDSGGNCVPAGEGSGRLRVKLELEIWAEMSAKHDAGLGARVEYDEMLSHRMLQQPNLNEHIGGIVSA